MKIKKLIINHYLLIIILFVAAFLRLYKLGSIPPHLTPDEANLGYNAYSILKTGKDEYGQVLPIIFKSFGDYKPGLYVYLTVPFVAFFGLTEFAVRLPSAIVGIIAIYLLYLVVNKLYNKPLAISAAMLLAISPWHIHFSRGAWEASIALALTLAGIYFFIKSFNKNKLFFWSVVFFALTVITYQGAKLSTAMVVLILIALYWSKVINFDKKVLLSSVLVGLAISAPIAISLIQGKAGRLVVFSVFSYPRPADYLQGFLDQGNERVGDLSYYLFHSEKLNFSRGILGRYFNHFSTRFLFFEGDWQNPRHSAPNHGMLLLVDLIVLPMGMIYFLKDRLTKEKIFVLAWLLLAPLPSVLSRDQVHAVRAYNMVIPLIIISAYGLIKIVGRFRVTSYVLFVTFYLLSLAYFLDSYFVHLPRHGSKYWEYGYKQIVETITPIQSNFAKIKVQQSFAQPYIYFLFYKKYDPSIYQLQSELVDSEFKGDVGYIEKLDNIEFAPIDWSVNRGESGTLFVADPVRIPIGDVSDSDHKVIKEIKYLDGNPAFRIIEVL